MSWVTIEGYEGLYAVSDDGRVMSMDYAQTGLPGILKPQLRRGYLSVFIYRTPRNGKWFTIHALVLAAFVGPRQTGKQVNHKNGVKTDNAVSNLEYCTQSENMKHAFRTGLQSNQGEKHSRHKLTAEKIIEIRRRVKSGETQTSVAKDVGVSQGQISHIVSGRAWPHITQETLQ